ncbi:MAG: hypothetical protein VB140_10090, partial [Burkholderia sp.]
SPFASASSTAWRTSLVRNPFVSPELCPSDAIASSRSIYATTPFPTPNFRTRRSSPRRRTGLGAKQCRLFLARPPKRARRFLRIQGSLRRASPALDPEKFTHSKFNRG